MNNFHASLKKYRASIACGTTLNATKKPFHPTSQLGSSLVKLRPRVKSPLHKADLQPSITIWWSKSAFLNFKPLFRCKVIKRCREITEQLYNFCAHILSKQVMLRLSSVPYEITIKSVGDSCHFAFDSDDMKVF